MAVTNPIYDIDMNGLEELFLGVVAYVEVRSGFEDISNEIAREMRQMGAVVSDKRDHKVTHVIFREGTLRTSDWAKKHNVPLVGVGWLAASARNKMKFLCTPWREEYLEEQLDACGFKKKMRYKKYCKAMNVEEFEAEMHKSAEKIKKKLNQSLNKSKSITKTENSEYERLMKLTDPCLRPRPPTPEFVKKHIRRHERIRQGGRFSWESSDEEKDEENNDIEYLTNEDCNENKENKNGNIRDTSFIEPVLNSPTPQSLVMHYPKNNSPNANEKDFNPIKKSILKKTISRKSSTIKEFLPKVVQTGITNMNQNKKRRESNDTDVPSPKIQKISDRLSTDLLTNESLINNEIIPITQSNKMTPVLNQFPWNKIVTNNIPLSPLVTNIASMNYPASSFTTPKSKKKSLRTKLLKNSAKRRYQESECSSNENELKLVLVPDTVQVTSKPRPYINSSPDICTIPETPLIFQPDNSFTISDLVNSSQTSVIIQSQKDDFASNTSKTDSSLLLTKKIVRRSTRLSNCDSVIEKPDLSQSKSEKTDNFKNSAKGKKQNVKKLNEQVEGINDIFTFKDNAEIIKSNIRRSNRISKQFVSSQDATENVEIESKPPAQLKDIAPQRNLKRHWSVIAKEDKKEAAEKKSKEKLNEIVEKPVHKFKKFRDSTDDFIFNSSKKTNRGIISKSLMYPICNEIVFVGFDPDDCQSLKATCKKMPREFTCVDVIRTKEQLIVVSEKPKKSLELIKAFILGNTFVAIKWFQECVTAKKWLSWSSFIITYSDITKVPLIDTTSQTTIEHLFKDYTPMYISTNKQSLLPKYKLRLIIQHCGGIVTDSFRQAGLVIDTRKVNALSVTSSWILDCVKEGLILDHKKYQIA